MPPLETVLRRLCSGAFAAFVFVFCGLIQAPSWGATLTNTNTPNGAAWDTSVSGWSTNSGLSTPWDSVNGPTNIARINYGSGSLTVASGGVWLGGLTCTNSSSKFSIYGSGTLTFGSAAPQITITTNTYTLTNYAPIAVASGTQTLTKAGSGILLLNGSSNAFSSLLVVSNGALVLTNGCWMGASTLVVGPSNNSPYIMAYGSTLGTVTIPVSPSASAANLFVSNSTILGQLSLAATTNGFPVYSYGGNKAAGYAQISSGSAMTNVLVNGRLEIIGGLGMTVSGLNGTTNASFSTNSVSAPGGINGTGLIAVYATNAATNEFGGRGMVLSFVPGATFSQLFKGTNSFATLVQSGSGTVSFGTWGYNSTNTVSNTSYTFSGGSWNLGQLGQNNPGAMDGGTNLILGDASVSVLANCQYSHAVWIVGPGNLRFLSGLAEFGPDNVPLQITVNGGGTLSVAGDYYSGNYDLGYLNNGTNPAGSVHRLTVSGGSVILPGTLGIGRNFGYNLSITNDFSVASVGSGTLSAADLVIGYSGSGKVLNQSNTLNLSGGKLILSGTMSAGTNSGQKDTFAWTGGQFTFGTLNAVGTNWGGTGASLSNNTLIATSGVLAPGDIARAGASTITGSLSLSGNGTLAIDLGGTNAATSFQTTNSGTSDSLVVSGTTLLGGTLSVSILPGYTPTFSDTLTVLVSSNGISGNFTNAAVGRSISPDGTNGFVLSLSGNALLLSQYHVLGAPSITLQPFARGVAFGDSIQMNVSAVSPIPVSYQWYFNAAPLPGETNASLLLTNADSSRTGAYYAVASNADGAVNSLTNILTVITNTTVIGQPASALVNPGGSTTISVTATSSLSLTYQWQFNGTDIPGATNASLTLSNAQTAASGSYQVLLTTSEGTISPTAVQIQVLTNGALSLTNTNSYAVWDSTGTGWSAAPVDSPWSALNGRFFTAVVTNTSAFITVDSAGVNLNSLQATGSRPVVFGGGPLILAGETGSIVSPVSSSGIILNSPLSSLGNGTFTVSGSGSLVLNSGGDFSGTLKVSGGADLVISPSSSLRSASVTVSDAGSVVNCSGTLGSCFVNGNGNSTWGSSSGNAGSLNLVASNATFLGSVVIAGPDTVTKFAYVAPNMPNGGGSNYGYASFSDGVTVSNVTVNGRLDLLGSSAMSVSGITGISNGQTNWAGGGSGAIVSGNTYAASNSAGGLGNVYNFTAGSAFSGFYLAKNTFATLTQSGSGTTSFGIFGQLNGNNTPLPTNNITTLSGGNWVFGQLGQNNGSQMAYGNFNLRNGANVTVGGNTGAGGVGLSHGFWNISSGSMSFLGNVGQAGGGDGYNNQAWDTLQFTVGTNGRLSSIGNFQLGVNAACVVTNPSSITVNGGAVNISGALFLGNAANASNAVSNDVIAVMLNSGTLAVSNGITVGYNSTNGLVVNEQATLTLAGGKLLSAGAINALTAINSNSSITSSFVWSGGQLSASSVTASNSFWNGPASAIRGNTLYNTYGILSPGDFGMGGKTTITGNYVQGSNAVLDIDLGGSSPATGFQSGTNTYDTVSVTGTATLAGTVRVRLANGFQPVANQTFTILSAASVTANLATNTVVSSDGTAQFSVTVNGGSLQLASYTPLYPPVITVPPASTNVLIGDATTLSVTATSPVTPFAYQWTRNGTNLPGATNATLTLGNVGPSSTGSYAVLVTNAQGSNWSPVALVGLTYPAPVILSQPSSITLSSGSSLSLSANVISTDPNTSWQWLFNGIPMAGATNPTLSIASIQVGDAGSYALRVSNSGGSVTTSSASVGVLLTPPAFTTPLQPVTCAIGENPVFNAAVDSFGTNVSYQWTRNGTDIAGATNASLTLTNAQLTDNGTAVGLVVSNSAGNTTNLPVALTVTVFSPKVLGLKQINYSYQGGQTLSAAPAPGIHPRIFFNAEDLPAIRARLTNTQVGIEAFRMCQVYTTFLRSGTSAYYAGTNNWNLTMPDGTPRISNTGFCDKSAAYAELVAGKTTTLANWITTDPNGITFLSTLSGEMTMEAFECLIKDGQSGISTRAANLAKAMDTWAAYVLADPAYPGYPVGRVWEFGQHQMALTYDLAYNYMTKDQRDHVRKALALMMTCLFNHSSAGPNSPINGVGYKGVGQAPESVTSNHVAIDTYKLLVACALEGEVTLADGGFDNLFLSQWFAKAMGAMHDFLTYGFFDDGGQWEGQGKNYLYGEHLIPMARRGYNFFAHPHVQAYMKRWLPAVIQPYGYSFTSYDLLGGSGYNAEKGRQFIHGGDFLSLKWMFPNDPAADLGYRNYILTEYKDASSGQWKTYIDCTMNKFTFHGSYFHGLIPLMSYPSDISVTNSLKQQFTDILGSLDYLEPTGATLVSRSSFDTNAMSTIVHMRQDFGGHTFSDRNAFSITALGRLFLRFSSGSSSSGVQNGAYQNIIDVDGLEMYITPQEGDKMRIPEKVAAWTPTNGPAMFITGDTTYAYSWQWIWNNFPTGGFVPLSGGYQPEMNCFNNFRRADNRDPLAYGDIPFVNFPQWDTPDVNEGVQSAPYNPMLQVMRTVGMVRGTNPYMLEFNDIQKDLSPHDYLWHTCVSDDLTLLAGTNLPAGCNAGTDLVLQEPAATGNRSILIRFLSEDTNGVRISAGTNVLGQFTNGAASVVPYVGLSTNYLAGDTNLLFQIAGGNGLGHLEFQTNTTTKDKWTRLVHELSNSVAPGFKILYYPFTNGAAIPSTVWGTMTNSSGTNQTLTIAIGSQTDTVIFFPRTTLAGGSNVTVTEFTISRAGSNLVDYRNQIQPCNVRDPSGTVDVPQSSPTGLSATIPGGNRVTLSWTNPSAAFTNLILERSLSGAANWTPLSPVLAPGTTSYTDSNVATSSSYDYRLAVVGASGVSPFASLTAATTQPAPSTLTATPGSAQVALSWSAVPTAASYSLMRSTVSGGPYATIASGLTATSYTDTAVTRGVTYYYYVTADGATGQGVPSAEVSAAPLTMIQAWRQQVFGSTNNTGSGADNANPSGDGIPNLMKYALGLNPLSTNAAAKPLALLTNGYLQISFTRTNDPTLLYTVEGTSDFASWIPVWSSTGSSNTNGPVTIRDTNAPVSSTTRRFLRLKVTSP